MNRQYQVFMRTTPASNVTGHGPTHPTKKKAIEYAAALKLSKPTHDVFIGVIGWELHFPPINKVRITKLEAE